VTWAGERMIIRTGYMTLVVVDVASAMEQITNLAASYDGFVVSSNSWQDQDRMYASISFRVVSERFNDTLKALRALAVEVKSESTSGQDVTEEYVDLTAKLRNLEAAETQLLKLMEQAGEVSDILEVQRELVKTRGEIEQTKGRMQYLEQSSSMSYIEVNLEQSKLTVEFNADTRSVKEGYVVWFFPNVSGGFEPYSYEWDFGDGSTSTDVQPSHAYKSDGSYTVKLKVTDDRGNMVPYERADYITVLPGWSAGNIASSAWNGLVGFGRVILNILIWLGIFSPVWIVISVILYFAWWRRRKKT
jgi:molybdopterin converting factor small subunit